jgi:putative endonuclease
MPVCYILYSPSLNSFYTGSTSDAPDIRLEKYLLEFYGKSKYTAKVKDWEIYISIPCGSVEVAIKLEKRIKRMKSKKFIVNLKRYPEMLQKLLIELNP